MAKSLIELLTDEDLRSRLAALGGERQAAITWQATARGTLLAYSRAAWTDAGGHREAPSCARAS